MYSMYRLLTVFIVFAVASAVNGQIPRTISYQGMLTDGSGNVVPDGNHSLTLRIYNAGGTQLYTETQTVAVSKGIFNVIIGNSAPLPGSLTFAEPYFLGVVVDGGTELTPRTALTSAPYALNAAHAHRSDTALVALSGGGGSAGVTSVNTIDGAISVVGAGGTTVTNNAGTKTITISSSGGGGTGIQGVQNADGTLSITNPNGPTATIDIANNSIGATKLSTDVGSLVKVSGGNFSATPTDVSIFADLNFMTDDLSITFPTVSGVSDPMINMFTSGTENASRMVIAHSPSFPTWGIQYKDSADEMHFLSGGSSVLNVDLGSLRVGIGGINNPVSILEVKASSSEDALKAWTNGSGRAGFFVVDNAASTAFALWGTSNGAAQSIGVYGGNTGAGRGGYFEITNASGTGAALTGNTQGLGAAGVISNVNSSNSSTALIVSTNGTGRAASFTQSNAGSAAVGVQISQAGTGYGLEVTTAGTNPAANFMNTNASNITPAVRAEVAGNGPAVSGYTTGSGGRGGSFRIANAANTTYALYAETNGTAATSHGILGQHSASTGHGGGVQGETNSTSTASSTSVGATGVYGIATPTSGASYSAGVRGINSSTGGGGIGVIGFQNGTGWGVYGETGGAGYAIYSNGNAYKTAGGNTWTVPSDSRLKEQVRPFTDGLDVLEQIEPKRYYYNGMLNTRTGDEEIGILAEDMARIAPYTVKPYSHQTPEGATMDILTYNSGALTYVTINAIKELAAEVRDLRQELEVAKTLLRENGIDPEGKLPPVSGR